MLIAVFFYSDGRTHADGNHYKYKYLRYVENAVHKYEFW